MKNELKRKYILDSNGRLTEYGLMLLTRMDEDALIGLTIDMEREVENKVYQTLLRCNLSGYRHSTQAEEIRQIIYIRILTIYSEKFNFKRFKNSDSFYVEGWKLMEKEKLLEEYKKYLEKREREGGK
ncbi:MAG: hypothetical protein MJ134_10840 [Lachnospiraceae bacterium]|nr:hypothetical protein [Lachnospiraceae bacterium]